LKFSPQFAASGRDLAGHANQSGSMPELPDVELFKRHLDATCLGRTIRNVTVNDPTPSDRCVRFASAVADDCATLASRRRATTLPGPVFSPAGTRQLRLTHRN
jgi:hypothetical protein